MATIVGLISDTHGLLRPEAIEALAGCSLILHAGDVGGEAVLAALRHIAPVRAVRGNNDHGPWAEALPETDALTVAEQRVFLTHDVHQVSITAASGVDVVVSGHSHRPGCVTSDGVLFVNPGSAGPRRFRLPIAVARLHLGPGLRRAEMVELTIR